jgi:predicted nucleic acid-binding Zn ribbon protein
LDLSKYQREQPSTVPRHRHCGVCGTPTDLKQEYCSDKCKVQGKKIQRTKMRNIILITGAVFVFYIAFLLFVPK